MARTIYFGNDEVCRDGRVMDADLYAFINRPGEIELYWADDDGTEMLPDDANFEVHYHDSYGSIREAAESIDFRGRGFLSTPSRGRYTHRVRSVHGSVEICEI